MVLPKFIPAEFRSMMVSFRPATDETDPDDLFLLTQEQTEAQLQKQLGSDKMRAVKNNTERIKKVKAFLNQAGKNKDPNAQERLEAWLDTLHTERFNLLRNEVLNWAKDSVGLINERKMESFPGSPQYFKAREKRKQKTKDKDKQKQ